MIIYSHSLYTKEFTFEWRIKVILFYSSFDSIFILFMPTFTLWNIDTFAVIPDENFGHCLLLWLIKSDFSERNNQQSKPSQSRWLRWKWFEVIYFYLQMSQFNRFILRREFRGLKDTKIFFSLKTASLYWFSSYDW